MLALAAFTAGCGAALPPPAAGPDPAKPSAHAPPVTYRSTIGDYTPQRPVEPAPWREQNEQIAPAPKP